MKIIAILVMTGIAFLFLGGYFLIDYIRINHSLAIKQRVFNRKSIDY